MLIDKKYDLTRIQAAIQKAYVLTQRHEKICVGISGGSDSDVMLDLLFRAVPASKMRFVFFDTGIELQATKDHLLYLEDRYGIHIERIRATVPVPLGVVRYGLPFISKAISHHIATLQRHNFDFSNDGNKPYEFLVEKYHGCEGAFKWWCNTNSSKQYRIEAVPLLKEFMIQNPPDFRISELCCNGAKKDPLHKYLKENAMDLTCNGMRKAEGGVLEPRK